MQGESLQRNLRTCKINNYEVQKEISKMIIEEKDFRLTPVSETSPMFDLELLYTVRPKGKEARQEFKNVAYGISLESALRKVIQYRVSCKRDTTDLSTYLKDFREELDSLKALCGI